MKVEEVVYTTRGFSLHLVPSMYTCVRLVSLHGCSSKVIH